MKNAVNEAEENEGSRYGKCRKREKEEMKRKKEQSLEKRVRQFLLLWRTNDMIFTKIPFPPLACERTTRTGHAFQVQNGLGQIEYENTQNHNPTLTPNQL